MNNLVINSINHLENRMLRVFIQVQALLLVLISSFFLIKGMLTLSAKDLAELSKSKWDYNTAVTKNLTQQRSDTIVGFALLLLSFLLQSMNLLWPMRIDDFDVSKGGVVIAIVISVAIFLAAIKCSDLLQRIFYKKVMGILNKQYPLGNIAKF
ncbi:MAG TPA: hypothetical protein VMW72_13575 [Sedimentisphaerales bacterium]|nr:hypothetical protein [Sedimentisphaerales bacterium]